MSKHNPGTPCIPPSELNRDFTQRKSESFGDEDLAISVGKPPDRTKTAEALLMEMCQAGCMVSSARNGIIYFYCYYCRANAEPDSSICHSGTCPYWVAITLYGDPNCKGAPSGVINARLH